MGRAADPVLDDRPVGCPAAQLAGLRLAGTDAVTPIRRGPLCGSGSLNFLSSSTVMLEGNRRVDECDNCLHQVNYGNEEEQRK